MKISRAKIQRLQDCRLWNDQKLAQAAGLSRPTVYGLKSRESCSPETAGKLAVALEVNISEIIPEVKEA